MSKTECKQEEDSIDKMASTMVRKSEELMLAICKTCNGSEAPIVIGACLDVVQLATQQLPTSNWADTANFMRQIADIIESRSTEEKPMH